MNDLETLYDLFGGEFTSSAIAKGYRYHQQKRVKSSNITISEEGEITVNARVQGSESGPYEVQVYFTPVENYFEVDSECTCPIEFNCKHAIAAVASVLHQLPLETSGETHLGEETFVVPSANPALTPPARLSWELSQWLDAFKPPKPKKYPPPDKQLYFVLTTDPKRHTAQVELARATRLKSGQMGKPAAYSPSKPLSGWSPQPSPEDRKLLRLIISEQGDYPRPPYTLKGAFGADALKQLVETGRCFWREANLQTLLKAGQPRPAALDWNENPDGSQSTTVQITPPGAFVLALDPPHYVDFQSHECGPLQMAESAEMVERWLHAPPVPAEEAAIIGEKVQSLHLPAPRVMSVKHRQNVAAAPVLRLFSRKSDLPQWGFGGWKQSEPGKIHLAQLDFDYDGTRVRWNEPHSTIRGISGDEVHIIQRNERRERQLRGEMEEAGFHPYWSYTYKHELNGLHTLDGDNAWLEFIRDTLPALERKNWRIEFDDSFSFRPAQVDDWYGQTTPAGEDWFSVELGIIVEGQRVNLMPLLPNILGLLEKRKQEGESTESVDVKLPDGRIALLPTQRLLAIGQTLAELHDPAALVDDQLRVGRLRAAELPHFEGLENWKAPGVLRELADRLKAYECITPVWAPRGLNATLRPYQLEGLAWLQFLRTYNFGGILADDMGLGKTLQALAHVLMEKEAGRVDLPSLVVAPTSLMANWKAEAERFTPSLRVLVSHGLARKEHLERFADYDLVVTSYSLLPRDEELLKKQKFHIVILDEAQYVKNPNAKWSDVARSLSARHRLCMTGTPMENHLGELWSLMAFLSPGYLGSSKQFTRVYRTPIEKHGETARKAALAKRLRPFILRRKKEEVATDLPPKTEIVRTLELSGSQRDLYETIRIAMHERVQAEIARRGIAQSHIIILDALLKLRQVCCDPRLVKLEKARKVKESAKLEFLRDMLPELLDEGRRLLLFSQFTSMLDLIEPELATLKVPFVRLTGDTADRATPVKRFQNGEVPLFLISLKAGGTGLNLTAADTVIHYDPWWNPAVEQQATDRAHRIGQEKPVFVYKLITQGTVEEKIQALQTRKRELVAGLLAEGAGQNLQLTKEDLNYLFDPVT